MKKIMVLTAVLLCFSMISAAESEFVFRRTLTEFPVEEIRSISVMNINGGIKLEDTYEKSISITISSKDPLFSEVKEDDFWKEYFSVSMKDNILCLSVEMKEQKEKGLFGLKNREKTPCLDIIVQIPDKEFDIAFETVNGGIELISFKGNIKAKTVNGNIKTEDLHGQVSIKTVNGSINLYIDEISGESSIRTVNGSINAYLNPELNLSVDTKNVNGLIKINNLEFNETKSNKRCIKGVLNKPDSSMVIVTVNGNITLNNILDN